MTPPTAALPCPFCGCPPIAHPKGFAVSCNTPGCAIEGHTENLKKWNRRAPAVQATADADEPPVDPKDIPTLAEMRELLSGEPAASTKAAQPAECTHGFYPQVAGGSAPDAKYGTCLKCNKVVEMYPAAVSGDKQEKERE